MIVEKNSAASGKRTLLAKVVLLASLWSNSQQSGIAQSKPDFYSSLMSGRVGEVAQLVKENPSLINKDPTSGQPPLVETSQWGGPREMVELFVTNNADVNARGVWGRTALHFAAERGDTNTAELLLKHKADVNARDADGFTPIIRAIRSADMIKLLLARGADINAHGGRNTLYSQAVGNPQAVGPGVIDLILTNGVDVTISEDEGFYQAVLFHNDTNLVKKLVPYYAKSTNAAATSLLHGALEIALDRERKEMAFAIASACFDLQTNLLHKAVARGDDDAINSILSSSPGLANTKDLFGWTPLHLAAMLGRVRIVETLLSNQADVDSQDDIGNAPLHWAAFFGHGDVVARLLQRKATMDVQGNAEFNTLGDNNDTPLDFAIQQGFTSIATMLITNGANLGPHKWWGDTPLHNATAKENLELMKLLISRGANVNARRGANYKQSPLDIAVTGNSPESVRLLLANGASLQTQMQTQSGGKTTLFHLWAGGSGNQETAGQLLVAGCDLNAANGEGQTPLHIAVGKWVFAYKPDPNRTNANAKWPADFRIEDSGKEAAVWLLSHKANVNAKDKNGQTPLHLIVTRGNRKAIEALLNAGADVNATDTKGKTALALLEDVKVSEYRFPHGMMVDFEGVEKLLLNHGAKGPLLSPETESGLRFR